METPVFDALKALKEEGSLSFHFPGHKGRNAYVNWGEYMPEIDTTETEGMDNLLEPKGIIKKSQQEAAKVFGAKATLYAVNGSTGSIYIGLATITKPGDKLIVQRNSHKSVYSALVLNGIEPVYLFPHYNERANLYSGVLAEEVAQALKAHPDAKGVMLTYPNYYGVCYDLERIAEVVHEAGKVLMVDEAHGANLYFSETLPKSALACGADLVVQSTHKTLPGLTQTSMIHVGSDRIDLNKLRDRYQLYTTTSPSYLFTLSNEMAVKYMDEEGRKRLRQLEADLHDTYDALESIPRVHVFRGDSEDDSIYGKDMTKILMRVDGIRGNRIKKMMWQEHNIRLEMADYYHCLAVTTAMNTREDLNRLVEAMREIVQDHPEEDLKQIAIDMPKPEVVISPRKAYYAGKKLVSFGKAKGKIAAAPIIPYPPGVPLLAAGERITAEVYDYLRFLLQNELTVVGLVGDDEQLVVLEDE